MRQSKIEGYARPLNVRQSLIHQPDDGRARWADTIWGWRTGLFTTGASVLVNTLLAQLFRPLDMLAWSIAKIRQG
jgi:ATP-binding cassette subfamily B protein